MDAERTRSVIAWLVDGARSAAASEDVLDALCTRLVSCGIPLWRVAVFVRTLHPHVMGRRFLWRRGEGVGVREAPHDVLETAEFKGSPVAEVYATGNPIRRRLADAGCPMDFAILHDLKREGISDYLASPLLFTDGAIHVVTWTTQERGGFSAAEIAVLESVVAPLARVAEVRALRRTARNLLDTYVGRHTGEKILAGQIQRGHTEAIYAAIWLSDMRGFTTLADRLPAERLIGLLNRYFDCQVPAIAAQGGEVLKFMGDGLLAIFAARQDGADAAEVCARALAAALEVRSGVAGLGPALAAEGLSDIRFGLALHLGHVLYGNIGGGERLDFTCIGPAVNVAARIESVAARLGRTILASADFAERCGAGLISLGDFALPGFGATHRLFGHESEST